MHKDFVSLNGNKLNIYCNFNVRYKTNEKNHEGSLNALLN